MILWSLLMIVKSDPGYVSDEVFDMHGMRGVVREFKNEPKQLVWAMNKGHYERNALIAGQRASNADTNSSSSGETDVELGQQVKKSINKQGYDQLSETTTNEGIEVTP